MENLTKKELEQQKIDQKDPQYKKSKAFNQNANISRDQNLSQEFYSPKNKKEKDLDLFLGTEINSHTSLEDIFSFQNLDKNYQMAELNKGGTQNIISLQDIKSMEDLKEELEGKKLNIEQEKDLFTDEEWEIFKVSTEKEIKIFDSLCNDYIQSHKNRLAPEFVKGEDYATFEEIKSQKPISMRQIPSLQEIKSSREIHHELVSLTKNMTLKLSNAIKQFNNKYTIRLNALKDAENFNKALVQLNETRERSIQLEELLKNYNTHQEEYRKSITELIQKEEAVRKITSCIDLDKKYPITPPSKIIPYEQAIKDFPSKKEQIKTNIEGWRLVYEKIVTYIEQQEGMKNCEVVDEQHFAEACKLQLTFISKDLWGTIGMLGSHKIAIGTNHPFIAEIDLILNTVTTLDGEVEKLQGKLAIKYKNISIQHEFEKVSADLSQIKEEKEEEKM